MNIAGNVAGFDKIASYLTHPLVLAYGKRRRQIGRGSL